MRKYLLVGALAALSLTASAQNKRPDFPKLDKSPLDAAWLPRDSPFREKPTDATPVARVLYSRPQKNGRNNLFGPDTSFIVPYGQVWRTGANENTELHVYKPITIGGKKLAVGTYSLFTIPGAKEWTVILNTDGERWGSYAYDQKKDVVRVKVTPITAPDPQEALSMAFREDGAGKATLRMVWDTVEIDVPVTY